MAEPSPFHQAFIAQTGHDFKTCAACGASDLEGCAPTMERQQDGRYLCTICSHLGTPETKEPDA